jgi:hypothetical protein
MPGRRDAPVLSGEILTEPSGRRRRVAGSSRDIVEAEYETVIGNHARFGAQMGADRATAAAFAEAARNRRDHPARREAGAAFWIVGFLLVGGAFWFAGGHALMPPTVRPFAVAGGETRPPEPLSIGDVSSRIETRGGRTVLHVEGSVTNAGASSLPIPDLIIRVTAGDGTATRYRIVTGEDRVDAGRRFIFSTRLDAPDAGVENVSVMIRDGNEP